MKALGSHPQDHDPFSRMVVEEKEHGRPRLDGPQPQLVGFNPIPLFVFVPTACQLEEGHDSFLRDHCCSTVPLPKLAHSSPVICLGVCSPDSPYHPGQCSDWTEF